MDKSRASWVSAAVTGGALYLVLAATLVVYWPGLTGGFRLDDIPNLSSLGQYPNLDPLDRVILFVDSGAVGLFGRPLSLLSFVIHDSYWPTAAGPFLRTNILLHLLNGCLVFWLMHLIAQTRRDWSTVIRHSLPVLITALWLLHPLNVSTVLYVIQRMTELASLFMLSGMILYLKGRWTLDHARRRGYALMTGGVVVGLGLGILSKETAGLLPVYILVIELIILRSPGSSITAVPAARWTAVFLYLPLAAIAAWHIYKLDHLLRGYAVKPFTAGERLLTEPRVLLDYLGNIVVPRRAGTGLFHDDFAISTSLFEPVSTLLAVGSVIIAVAAAFMFRRQVPVLSFAIFWYIGGHVLEAGIIPLELYFEHRNYLPMLGILFGLAYLLTRLFDTRLRIVGAAAAAALLAVVGIATWQNTTLFGQPVLAAAIWADEHPRSQRAQQHAANIWSRIGDYERASKRVGRLIAEHPHLISPHVVQYQLSCLAGKRLSPSILPETLKRLRTGLYDTAASEALQRILHLKAEDKCPTVTYAMLERMTKALQANPRVNWGRVGRNLLVIEAQIVANRGEMADAAELVAKALEYQPHVKLSIFRARLLANAGRYDQALQVLDEETERIHRDGFLARDSLVNRLEHAKRNIIRRKEQAQAPQ